MISMGTASTKRREDILKYVSDTAIMVRTWSRPSSVNMPWLCASASPGLAPPPPPGSSDLKGEWEGPLWWPPRPPFALAAAAAAASLYKCTEKDGACQDCSGHQPG